MKIHSDIDSEKLKQALADCVISRCFPEYSETVSVGDWEIHDFSSCFTLEFETNAELIGIYVKVPKSEIRYRGIVPQVALDIQMAEEEYNSLVFLAKHWCGELTEVRFVEPLAFFPDFNAIATRRAYAQDLFLLWRRADLKNRLVGSGPDAAWLICMRRIGESIREYHESAASSVRDADLVYGKAVIEKIDRSVRALQEHGVDMHFLKAVQERLFRWNSFQAKCRFTMTLKGLDIRNVLIDERDQIFLLDPGKLKQDCYLADLARFFVTCDIVYWGSFWFFLRATPTRDYVNAVLAGYGGLATAEDRVVLELYTLKELFKHWSAAHLALSLKQWPRPIKWLIRRTYINPFYRQEIAKLLDRIEH